MTKSERDCHIDLHPLNTQLAVLIPTTYEGCKGLYNKTNRTCFHNDCKPCFPKEPNS